MILVTAIAERISLILLVEVSAAAAKLGQVAIMGTSTGVSGNNRLAGCCSNLCPGSVMAVIHSSRSDATLPQLRSTRPALTEGECRRCHSGWAQRAVFCMELSSASDQHETEIDLMGQFKEPSFKDRVAAANSAKAKALELLKNRPGSGEAELAERAERRRAKEGAEAEKRATAKAAREAAKGTKEQGSRAATKAAQPKVPTAEERKAARDARYAARKSRKL